MKRQSHFNREFYQDNKKGYWISIDYPRIRAHRWVWINNHGNIPKGYHIHHKDKDKSNNDISNLELIEASKHLRDHMTLERRKKASEWAAKIRPLTKKWHNSEEGIAWHKYHALKFNFGKWDFKNINCKVCKINFTPKTHHQEFCSNNCKSQWRRLSGLDDIKRICEGCKNEFTANKYTKTRFCTKKCRYI
jgi:hypothetical protein